MKRLAARCLPLVIAGVLSAYGCGNSPLVAPVASTISVFSSATALSPGDTATVQAYVIEEAGTPVHDGTVVKFFASLGAVDPVQAQTRAGVATATFTAGAAAGTAKITAESGGATSGKDQPNTVDIVIN